jgi:hypothetical protein
MAAESPDQQAESNQKEAEVKTAPPKRARRWKWPAILLSVFVVVPIVLFALWSWFALSYTYSSGDRAGYVQKFSSKGWVCKTWEGELSMVNIPGAAQERWAFSVRDDSVANAITSMMGNRVSLTYEEKRGIPTSCFGETDYFVTGVRKIE